MPYLYVVSFLDSGGNYTYQAFSSTDPTRTNGKLYLDMCYQIGFQPSYPSCKDTCYGPIDEYTYINWSEPLETRGNMITCVINNSHMLNTTYPIKGENQVYSTNIPATEGTITTISHTSVQPNEYYPESDSSGDSDDS